MYWTIAMRPSDQIVDGDYVDAVWRYEVRRNFADFVWDGEPLWDGEIRGQGETPPSPKDIVSDMLSNFSVTAVHSIGYWSKV
jgi:hypothetical protein